MELFGIAIRPWCLLCIAAIVLSFYVYAPIYIALWKDMRKYRHDKHRHKENA